MSTNVGTLTIEMAANLVRLEKDMASARKTVDGAMASIQKSVASAQNALATLGVGLSIGAFATLVTGAINAADKLNDLNKATGITVENLAGLELAAKQSGGDLDGIAQSINKLSVKMGEDANKFKLIGVTAKDPLEAFKQLSDIFVKIEDPQTRAALGAEALGKSWASAAPLLAEGGAKIQEMVDKGANLSRISPELVKAADAFNDKLAEIAVASKGATMAVAEGLLPILQLLADEFAESQRTGGSLSIIVDGIAIAFEAVIVVVANTVYVLKQVYAEIEGIAKQLGALATLDFTAFAAIGTQMKADAAAARKDIDAFTDRVLNARKNAAEIDALARRNPPKVDAEAAAKAAAAAAAAKKAAEEFLNYKKAETDAYDKVIEKADQLVAAIKFETEALTMSNVEKETAIALQKLLNIGIKEGTDDWEKYSEAVIFATMEKEQMKKLVDERKKLDEKAIADRLKAEEKFADDIKQINNQIGQSLTDALMEGGVNAKDFLIKMFKTMILRPVLQPLITGMVGGFTSSALPGAAAAAEGETSGGSVTSSLGVLGLASSLKSAYTMVTTGFTTLGTTVSNFVAESAGYLLNGAEAGSAIQGVGVTLAESATAIGTLASYAGGIGAGLGLGNLISDGKGIGGGSSWLTVGAGTAIGAMVGGPLGAAIGGVVGGLANAAFGTGKKKIDDTGLKITFNSMATTVKQYEDWSKKGGWFGGGGKGTELKDVDANLQKYIDVSVGAVAVSIRQYTDILGLPARDLTQYTQEVQRSLEGLSAEEAKKAIDEAIKAYANGLATFAAGEIAAYQRDGEQFTDTLARLGSSLKNVNDIFNVLNISLYDTSAAGADAASRLVEAFGGIDKFVASTDFYYQNFYSAQERAAETTENLGKVFEQLGLQLPSTNAQFRSMVEAARAAGNDSLFANLLKLAPTFSGLQKSLAELAAASVGADKSVGQVVDVFQEVIDAAYRNLQNAIQQEQKSAIDAINAQLKIAQAQKEVAQESVDSLGSIFDYLTGQINELSGTVNAEKSAAEGAAFIQNAILAANNTGYLPDQKSLEEAVSAVRKGIDSQAYATAYEQKLAQAKLAAQLSDLNVVAGEQKTTAELQLEVATQQIESLNAQADLTNAYYEQQLIYAQAQINELRNVNTSTLTVSAAMAALVDVVNAARAAAASSGGGGGGGGGAGGGGDSGRAGQINSMYQEILGRSAESAGLDAWNNSGLSIDQIREGIFNSPEAQGIRGYAEGGAYLGGLAMVGEDGPEMINFSNPGMVYTAAQTAALLGGSGGSEVVQELRSLREDNKVQARSIASLNLRMTRVFERWDGDGLPETRVETV